MTHSISQERGDIRLALAQLFEGSAIAARGDGAFTDATGTVVPATVRVVGMGQFPWFVVEFTAAGTHQTLLSERVFTLDGAIDLIEERGDLPIVWTAEV